MNYTKRKIRILMAIVALLFIGCCDSNDPAIDEPSKATELNLSYYQQLGSINTHSSILYSDNGRYYSDSTAMSIKEDTIKKESPTIDSGFDVIEPPVYLTFPAIIKNTVISPSTWWKWNRTAVPMLLVERVIAQGNTRLFFISKRV